MLHNIMIMIVMMATIVVVTVVVVVIVQKYTSVRLLTPGACNTQPLTLFNNTRYLEMLIKLFCLVFSIVLLHRL